MKEIEAIQLIGKTLCGIILGLVLAVPIHEMGHFAGGIVSGYRFVAIGILGLELCRLKTGFKILFRSEAPQGQCIMYTESMDRSPVPLVLGGIVSNAVIGSFLTVIGIMSNSPDKMAVLMGIGGMNLAFAIIGALSSSPYGDAATFREISSLPGGAEIYNRLMCVYKELEEGKTPGGISGKYLIPTVWESDQKRDIAGEKYYSSTLAAELMFFRYLKIKENCGSEFPERLKKERAKLRKFSGALRLLGYDERICEENAEQL